MNFNCYQYTAGGKKKFSKKKLQTAFKYCHIERRR